MLGGDERISLFHDEPAAGLFLGREVEAENLILCGFRGHGLGGRFDPDGYAEWSERTVPGAHARSLGGRLAEGGVATDEIGRAARTDTHLGGDGEGTQILERGGEGFPLVGRVEGEGVDAHEVEPAIVSVPVLGCVFFLVVPALEIVGQTKPDLEMEVGTVERDPVTCGVSHFAKDLCDFDRGTDFQTGLNGCKVGVEGV